MPKAQFAHVTTWIFDLDNTLYARSARLFDLIEQRMNAFVMAALGVGADKADRIRHAYWQRYGTTLSGLMHEHGVAPGPYLDAVHDIPLDSLSPDPDLCERIARLPGRKVVYTNGPRAHAERVTRARGLGGVFDALYGIEEAGFAPKPDAAAYDAIIALDGMVPERAAMFEDDARNLAVPAQLGMRCVLVGATGDDARREHVHHHAPDLAAFLARIGN